MYSYGGILGSVSLKAIVVALLYRECATLMHTVFCVRLSKTNFESILADAFNVFNWRFTK